MSQEVSADREVSGEHQRQGETETGSADKYLGRFRKFIFAFGVIAVFVTLLIPMVANARVPLSSQVFLIPVLAVVYFVLWNGLRKESLLAWKAAMGLLGLLGVVLVIGPTNPISVLILAMGLYWGWKAKDAPALQSQ